MAVTVTEESGRRFQRVALIDESRCIGCTRCLEACPVDAIVGAHNLMHTVIAAECIGCRLCLPPCPVDCIEMVPTPPSLRPASRDAVRARGQLAKARYRARQARLNREAERRRAKLALKKAALRGKKA